MDFDDSGSELCVLSRTSQASTGTREGCFTVEITTFFVCFAVAMRFFCAAELYLYTAILLPHAFHTILNKTSATTSQTGIVIRATTRTVHDFIGPV